MVFKDYEWEQSKLSSQKVSGELDETPFNRKDGFEVLFFINKLGEIWNLQRRLSGEKIERMIRVRLPENILTQEAARRWIHDNWDNFNIHY